MSYSRKDRQQLTKMLDYLDIDMAEFLRIDSFKAENEIVKRTLNEKLKTLTTYEDIQKFYDFVNQFYGLQLVGKNQGHVIYQFKHLYDQMKATENINIEEYRNKVSYKFNNGDIGEAYVDKLHKFIEVK